MCNTTLHVLELGAVSLRVLLGQVTNLVSSHERAECAAMAPNSCKRLTVVQLTKAAGPERACPLGPVLAELEQLILQM